MLRRPRFRPLVVLTAAAVMVVALLAGCTGGTDAVDTNANGEFRYVGSTKRGTVIPPDKRKQVGDVTGDLLTGGGTFDLKANRGQVVVLNYWASWCSPCVVEIPGFDQLYRTVKSQGIEFVGVGVKDTHAHLSEFVKDNRVSYPNVYDPNAKTALQLGRIPASSLPSTVILDRKGRVAAVYVGPVLAGDLRPVLRTLGAEK